MEALAKERNRSQVEEVQDRLDDVEETVNATLQRIVRVRDTLVGNAPQGPTSEATPPPCANGYLGRFNLGLSRIRDDFDRIDEELKLVERGLGIVGSVAVPKPTVPQTGRRG